METFLWICLGGATLSCVAAILGILNIYPFNQYFGSRIRKAIQIFKGNKK
jgi:hypothetical protein